jgi:hypothetical protein
MLVRPSRLKIVDEEHKITNILEFQLKNTTEKSHDVDLITKCHEYIVN